MSIEEKCSASKPVETSPVEEALREQAMVNERISQLITRLEEKLDQLMIDIPEDDSKESEEAIKNSPLVNQIYGNARHSRISAERLERIIDRIQL